MRLTSECLRFHVNTQVKWEAREEEVRQRFKSHFGSIAGVLHESEASLDNYFSKIEGDVTGVHGMVNRRVKEIIGLFQRATHADTATIDAMRRSLAQPFEMCKDIKGQYHLYVPSSELSPNVVFCRPWFLLEAT